MTAILATLLGHWRRHPLELATFLVGLALATALWSGVQALNAEARRSYADARAVLAADTVAAVVAKDGGALTLADYVAVRRAGWPVSPLVEGEIRRGDGWLRVVGVEPLTLPREAAALQIGDDDASIVAFLTPPHLGLAAPETVARLSGDPGLPPLAASAVLPADTLLVDIGVATQLLGTATVSRLLLPANAAGRPLPETLADRLRIVPPGEPGDLERLTASFHLNLTAFGFLSFAVGLFIVHAAVGLSFERRRPILRTLRACGVSARSLAATLVAELLLLALTAGAIGMLLGYGLAAWLLPDVAASLAGLYGARLPGELTLGPGWWLAGLAMSLGGALAAAATSLWRSFALPIAAPAAQAWRAGQERLHRRQVVAALILAIVAFLGLGFGRSLASGFLVIGATLLAAALLLPPLLGVLLALGARRSRRAVAEWAWADGRQQLSGLSLALMALLLALAVNIGVGTMVGSFRASFLGWLDQRLAADLYIAGRDADEATAIARWLAARPEVTAVLPIAEADARAAGAAVEILGITDDATYRDAWPLIAALPDAWDRLATADGILVSEQLARRAGLAPGSSLTIATPNGDWTATIVGTYADYGNPRGQVIATLDAVAERWPDADRSRLAVRVPPAEAASTAAALTEALGLDPTQVTDQASLKALSQRIFERTFSVTVALNALTLTVAGIALLASLLTLADQRLAQLAPLWALGLTRRRLALIELGKTLGLAALTAIAALPLGLVLAWLLAAVVNVRAFGWRIPVLLFPGHWASLFALALATALLAALWPVWRLRRATPADLLRSFSNER